MFSVSSNMRIGHRVEKAYDINNPPFTLMRVPKVDNGLVIETDCDNIIVSTDTRLLTARGIWKQADKLQQGELLKTVSYNAKITRLISCRLPIEMFYAYNSDRFCVNGFFIDG